MLKLSIKKENEMSVTNEQEEKKEHKIVNHDSLNVFRYKRILLSVSFSDIKNLRRFVKCERKEY